MILLSILYYIVSLGFTWRHFSITESDESYNNLHTVTQCAIFFGICVICPVTFIYMICNSVYKTYLV